MNLILSSEASAVNFGIFMTLSSFQKGNVGPVEGGNGSVGHDHGQESQQGQPIGETHMHPGMQSSGGRRRIWGRISALAAKNLVVIMLYCVLLL